MRQEQQPQRSEKVDLRVHACLYFIRPTGHTCVSAASLRNPKVDVADAPQPQTARHRNDEEVGHPSQPDPGHCKGRHPYPPRPRHLQAQGPLPVSLPFARLLEADSAVRSARSSHIRRSECTSRRSKKTTNPPPNTPGFSWSAFFSAPRRPALTTSVRQGAMPYSIIGSTEDVVTADGRTVKGREYLWGVAEGAAGPTLQRRPCL